MEINDYLISNASFLSYERLKLDEHELDCINNSLKYIEKIWYFGNYNHKDRNIMVITFTNSTHLSNNGFFYGYFRTIMITKLSNSYTVKFCWYFHDGSLLKWLEFKTINELSTFFNEFIKYSEKITW